jgi:hypothetical protein
MTSREREIMLCARALAYYEYGEAAPLPEGMTLADWRLVRAMLATLAALEADWFTDPRPLPLSSRE